ncbi:hypothetical protein WJ58_00790 [Burkholderia ubonensis]|nr:hypothetical protein WJ58_00790 [Burkholderia ubonensis]
MRFTVARNLDVEQVVVGRNAFAARAVAMVRAASRFGLALLVAQVVGQLAAPCALEDRLLERGQLLVDRWPVQRPGHQLFDQLRVKVQALARFYRHFFLAFAWHKSGSLAVSLCLTHTVSDRLVVSARSTISRTFVVPHHHI